MDRKGLWYRMRGLDKMQERFHSHNIERFVSERSGSQKIVRILEIGFGEGKCLIELQTIFPKARFYGINNKKTRTMSSSRDILSHSKDMRHALKVAPKIYFYDAGDGLHFPDGYFDLVISQVAIHYVGNKCLLYEDIWRVLKKDGLALLHVDTAIDDKYPDFMFRCKDTPRMVIYDGKRIISTKSYFDRLKSRGFDITFGDYYNTKKQYTLIMRKNITKALDMRLAYDGNSTIYLTPLANTDGYKIDTTVWWGTRSIFKLK